MRAKNVCPLANPSAANESDLGFCSLVTFTLTATETAAGGERNFSLPFDADIVGIQTHEDAALTGNPAVNIDIGGTNSATTHTHAATAQYTLKRTSFPDTDTLCRNIAANTTITVEFSNAPSAGSITIMVEVRRA